MSYEPTAPYSSYDRRDSNRGEKYDTQQTPEIGTDYERSYEDDTDEVYIVRQNIGYFSIIFSAVQTIILGVMMWQCGIAPLKIK